MAQERKRRSRYRTSVTQHRATFKAAPFMRGSASWNNLGEWVIHELEHATIDTIAADYLAAGGRELTGLDLPTRTYFDETVERAFVFQDSPGMCIYGTVVCLTRHSIVERRS